MEIKIDNKNKNSFNINIKHRANNDFCNMLATILNEKSHQVSSKGKGYIYHHFEFFDFIFEKKYSFYKIVFIISSHKMHSFLGLSSVLLSLLMMPLKIKSAENTINEKTMQGPMR